MIRLHALSPANELPVAERLRELVAAAWPDVAESKREHVDILAGVRTGVDCDLLAIVDLERPRAFAPQRRRGGAMGPSGEVQHAVIAIEVKQLDVRDFDRIGNQLFARYGGAPAGKRSATDQARDAAHGVKAFLAQQVAYPPYVYALAWLTALDDAALAGIDPATLGESATWPAMLDACAQQNSAILRPMPPDLARTLGGLRARLLNRRVETRRDVARVDSLSRQGAAPDVDRLFEVAGSKQIQIVGRGGSGKTTTLALLAVRLAEAGERVLILTFHRTLRSDIAHLVDSVARRSNVPGERILVETAMGFLLSALTALDVETPMLPDGSDVDWNRLDAALDETRGMLVGGPDDPNGDAAKLRAEFPARFAWDHVVVDEAQDWHDQERDFLRALYGPRRLVLSDGLDQLVRRRVACNWVEGIAKEERFRLPLDTSLRMLRNVALFAGAVARAIGFETWHIAPHEALPGGRVIIIAGDLVDAAFLRAISASAHEDRADVADCLVCVPPKSKALGDEPRLALLRAAEEAGIPVWDGTLPENRDALDFDAGALRIVRYDSCRGLEGWIAVALDLDELVAQKIHYPNAHPGDPQTDAEQAALRWMLIPLTRGVQTLVITLRDPHSRTAEILREATREGGLPAGTVTWFEGSSVSDAAVRIASQAARSSAQLP